MSFSEKTIRTLEFDKICAMLEEHAETEGAKVMARNLRPSEDTYTVLRRLRRTTDARNLADAKGAPSFGRIRDIASAWRWSAPSPGPMAATPSCATAPGAA